MLIPKMYFFPVRQELGLTIDLSAFDDVEAMTAIIIPVPISPQSPAVPMSCIVSSSEGMSMHERVCCGHYMIFK